MAEGLLPGTMAACHSSFIIEIGVYLLQAGVECFCFSSDFQHPPWLPSPSDEMSTSKGAQH